MVCVSKCTVPHKCVPFSSVVTALSAAGKVILQKRGLSVTLECKTTHPKSNLEWLHGDERIYRYIGSTGHMIKGMT